MKLKKAASSAILFLLVMGLISDSAFAQQRRRARPSNKQAVDRVDVDALKKKYWETGDPNEVRVVQNRLYSKSGRIEIGVLGSSVSGDPFIDVKNAGGLVAYHLNEDFALGFLGWKSFTKDSTAMEELERSTDPPQRAATNKPSSFLGGELGYSPIYGKLSVFGKKIVHYDIHVMAGAGVTGSETGQYFTPLLGVGQKLFVTNRFVLRLDYRYMRYREEAIGTRASIERNKNTNVISLGFSMFL